MTGLRLIVGEPPDRGRRLVLGGDTVAAFRRRCAARGYPPDLIADNLDMAFRWPPDLPACPSWCRHSELYGREHDYDGPLVDDLGTYVRSHISSLDDPHLTQEERNRDGVVTLTPIMIVVGGDVDPMTSSEARRYAADLFAAAEQLDRIEGQQ